MPIGENLKFLRLHFGITQEELSKIAKVSNQSVSNWENGLKIPRMGAIQRIADVYNIRTSDIIEDGAMQKALTKTPSDRIMIDLLQKFNSLNIDGQKNLLELAEMLSSNPKYSLENKESLIGVISTNEAKQEEPTD